MGRVRKAGICGTSRTEVKGTSDQIREILRLSWGKRVYWGGVELGWERQEQESTSFLKG